MKYSIVRDSFEDDSNFDIDEDTGKIFVLKELDRESVSQHQFQVRVSHSILQLSVKIYIV